jgi:aspartyl-tRNA(Asn)/glutamyl-tRNA(Gln) amidotransferase subunit C
VLASRLPSRSGNFLGFSQASNLPAEAFPEDPEVYLMSLDKATVARIATLARIKVPEADLEALGQELNKILHWVEQLDQVDTTGVEPMTSVAAMTLPLRADKVTDGDRVDDILKNAPSAMHGFFTVPKVVE